MSSPVASPTEKSDPPKRQRGWRRLLQFRLRAILILTTLIAIWLGWWLHSARQQREAVAELRKAGASIEYDFQWQRLEEPPDWPAWLVDLLGVDCFEDVVAVSLSGTQLTDADLEYLKGLNSLVWIDLRATQLTDAGLEHLKDLTLLQAMYLSETRVTDVGVEHLKGLTSLQSLSLSHTLLTDAGLEHLKGLTSLQYLYIRNTEVTDAGAARLQKSLPNCDIKRSSLY